MCRDNVIASVILSDQCSSSVGRLSSRKASPSTSSSRNLSARCATSALPPRYAATSAGLQVTGLEARLTYHTRGESATGSVSGISSAEKAASEEGW